MARRSLTGPIDEAKKEDDFDSVAFLEAFRESESEEEAQELLVREPESEEEAQELLANIEIMPQSTKEEAFFISVVKQFTECIRTLINNGVDINTTNEQGDTALYLSVDAGYIPFLNFLIDLGADLNFINSEGKTALMMAVTSLNGLESVNLLLEKGANINIKDEWYGTALHHAVQFSNSEILEALLAKATKQDVDIQDDDGVTALYLAASKGDVEKIQKLIDKNADLDIKDNGGKTVLHFAAEYENSEILEALLAKATKEDVDIKDDRDGYTALYLAAVQGDVEKIQKLIKKNADLNLPNNDGVTPLMIACMNNGTYDAIETLLNEGANVKIKDEDGRTALHCVFEYNISRMDEIITLLIKKGADINAENKFGETPIFACVENIRDVRALPYLLENGARIYIRNTKGETILSKLLAIKNDNERIGKLTVLNKAGLYMEDQYEDLTIPIQQERLRSVLERMFSEFKEDYRVWYFLDLMYDSKIALSQEQCYVQNLIDIEKNYKGRIRELFVSYSIEDYFPTKGNDITNALKEKDIDILSYLEGLSDQMNVSNIKAKEIFYDSLKDYLFPPLQTNLLKFLNDVVKRNKLWYENSELMEEPDQIYGTYNPPSEWEVISDDEFVNAMHFMRNNINVISVKNHFHTFLKYSTTNDVRKTHLLKYLKELSKERNPLRGEDSKIFDDFKTIIIRYVLNSMKLPKFDRFWWYGDSSDESDNSFAKEWELFLDDNLKEPEYLEEILAREAKDEKKEYDENKAYDIKKLSTLPLSTITRFETIEKINPFNTNDKIYYPEDLDEIPKKYIESDLLKNVYKYVNKNRRLLIDLQRERLERERSQSKKIEQIDTDELNRLQEIYDGLKVSPDVVAYGKNPLEFMVYEAPSKSNEDNDEKDITDYFYTLYRYAEINNANKWNTSLDWVKYPIIVIIQQDGSTIEKAYGLHEMIIWVRQFLTPAPPANSDDIDTRALATWNEMGNKRPLTMDRSGTFIQFRLWTKDTDEEFKKDNYNMKTQKKAMENDEELRKKVNDYKQVKQKLIETKRQLKRIQKDFSDKYTHFELKVFPYHIYLEMDTSIASSKFIKSFETKVKKILEDVYKKEIEIYPQEDIDGNPLTAFYNTKNLNIEALSGRKEFIIQSDGIICLLPNMFTKEEIAKLKNKNAEEKNAEEKNNEELKYLNRIELKIDEYNSLSREIEELENRIQALTTEREETKDRSKRRKKTVVVDRKTTYLKTYKLLIYLK